MTAKKGTVNTDGEFFRLREACRYSRLGESTLRKAEAAGRIRFLRPTERTVLIERREIDRFLRGE
jgi:excisionase family DNA binding protein